MTRTLLLAVGLLLGACAGGARPAADAGPVPETGSVSLRLDQTREIDGLRLTWVLVEDSRCPEGAQCVWAGEAKVRLHVTDGADEREIALTLGAHAEAATVTIKRHELRLEDVTPHPRLGTTVARADYRATVVIRPL